MNFLQLTQELRQEVGYAGLGPTAVTGQTGDYAKLVSWVNRAYQEIQNKWLDWKFLWASGSITLALNTGLYDAPATNGMINEDSFYIGTTKLTLVDYEEYRQMKGLYDSLATGTPREFTIRPDGKLLFFPAPNLAAVGKVVNFEYQKAGTKLAIETDNPLIPPAYQDTILWRAKMYWAEFEEAQPQYQQALSNFTQAMFRLEAAQLPSHEFAHGRVQGANIVIRPV